MAINEKTLKRTLARQVRTRWGKEYVPSIKATKSEASRYSRPHMMLSSVARRPVHLLSSIEYHYALIAHYIPGLFEIHEQRMLPMQREAHPLAYHPEYADTRDWSTTVGSVECAEELGLLKYHPTIHVGKPGHKRQVPYPLHGDLLLFIRDELGAYAVNWTVKASMEGFLTSTLDPVPKNPKRNREKAIARHAIESKIYEEMGIRTVQVVGTDLNKEVLRNLILLHPYQTESSELDKSEQKQTTECVLEAFTKNVPPLEALTHLTRQLGCYWMDVKSHLFKMIWRRLIPVDLYSPILVDEPLKPARKDFLKDLSGMYSRMAPV